MKKSGRNESLQDAISGRVPAIKMVGAHIYAQLRRSAQVRKLEIFLKHQGRCNQRGKRGIKK